MELITTEDSLRVNSLRLEIKVQNIHHGG